MPVNVEVSSSPFSSPFPEGREVPFLPSTYPEPPPGNVVPLRSLTPVEQWRNSFCRLNPEVEPCPGFGRGQWSRIYDAALAFLDQHGNTAAACGWTTLDLFAVHPTVGVARMDCLGVLMISGADTIEELTPDRMRYRSGLRYYRAYLPPSRPTLYVPVWSLTETVHEAGIDPAG